MSEMKQRIEADMKSAMKAKDKNTLRAIRMILEAIKQKEIDERIVLDERQILSVIQKMVKQRKDSIVQFKAADRTDLVDVEEDELAILNHYMPAQLSEAQVSTAVDKMITDVGATSMADMGKLMKIAKEQLSGKADMGTVSNLIRAKLS